MENSPWSVTRDHGLLVTGGTVPRWHADQVSRQDGKSGWTRRILLLVLGWFMVILGVAALALPGPGLLLLAGGLAVLSQEYAWAERRLEPVKARAFDTARAGVKTNLRIVLSALGALSLVAIGVLWAVGPRIPKVWIFGPELPFAGWGTGSSLIVSGIVALGLLVYSIRRWRGPGAADERQRDAAAAESA